MAGYICFFGDNPSLILCVSNVVQRSCNIMQIWARAWWEWSYLGEVWALTGHL